MQRLVSVSLILLVIGVGCTPTPSLKNRTYGSIADPSGSPGDHMGYFVTWESHGGDRCYGVVTYGREVKLTPAPNPNNMMVDGKVVTPPDAEDGVLWALTADGKYHRLELSRQEVADLVVLMRADGFLTTPLWRDRLGPLMKKHRWSSP